MNTILTNKEEEQLPEHNAHPALKAIANFISYVFHPIFIPLLMVYVLYILMPASFASVKPAAFSLLMIRVAVITAFFPLLFVALAKGLGFIDSILLKRHKDRIIPLMAVMIFYFWNYWVFKNDTSIPTPIMCKVISLASLWGVVALFMANIFVKVSMHATAIGGLLGMAILLVIQSPVNMMLPLFIAIVLAGIVGTARMILSAHKLSEVYFGYAIGVASMMAAWVYLM